jgi:diketogulonate reductase-like aldo/keto reductase
MKPVKLNSGTTIPPLGLGLWHMKDRAECIAAVKSAMQAGYRHFDTAQIYGNEAFLGEALQAAAGARAELFITTKLWNDNMWWDDVLPSFEQSLENLRTDYVDLLLMHFPVTELRRPAWRQLEKIAKSGQAKAIGVSNYTVRHLEELLAECDIKPAVNQVELHVFLQQPGLVKYCQDNDIVVEAYSPLAHGESIDDPVLAKIASKHHKSPAQIMIRWAVEMGAIALPKSTHPDRIAENLNVFDFQLDADDLAQIATLERNLRTCWDPTHVA